MYTSGIPKWGGIHPSTATSHLVSTLLQTNIYTYIMCLRYVLLFWRVFHIAKRHQTAPPWRVKCSSFTTIAIDFDFERAPQKWKKHTVITRFKSILNFGVWWMFDDFCCSGSLFSTFTNYNVSKKTMFSIFQLQTPPFMVVQYLIDAFAEFFAHRHIPMNIEIFSNDS